MIGYLFRCTVVLMLIGTGSSAWAQTGLTVRNIGYSLPILVNMADNPAAGIEIVNNGNEPVSITEITVGFGGTVPLSNIRRVRIFASGKKGDFDTGKPFGSAMAGSAKTVFKGELSVKEKIFLWIAVDLDEKTDLTKKLQVRCENIRTGGSAFVPENIPAPVENRLGKAIRYDGQDSVHTYRIPGITTTNNGTLLAIYDIRRDSHRDLQGNIDIGLSRSTNGGRTWEPMQVVLDMGEWGGLPGKFNGVSDANILVDRSNNNIFVFGLWMHGVLDSNGRFIHGLTETSDAWEHQWRNKGSQPGYDPRQTSQLICTMSKDDGRTWSKPENLTRMFKKESWWLATVAPGHGITLEDGTLVVPTQGRDESGRAFSNITYSKDHGKTWKYSNPAYHGTTENMAVQLSDESIMLNMRHGGNRNNTTNNGRAIAVTKDLGETWEEHPGSRKHLIEPVCMASIHKHEYTENGKKKCILVFSNPNSTSARDRMTIKVSFDDGVTWPEAYWMLLDQGKSRGYSCLTSVNENTIGILYEGSRASMTFQKIPLAELLLPRGKRTETK